MYLFYKFEPQGVCDIILPPQLSSEKNQSPTREQVSKLG